MTNEGRFITLNISSGIGPSYNRRAVTRQVKCPECLSEIDWEDMEKNRWEFFQGHGGFYISNNGGESGPFSEDNTVFGLFMLLKRKRDG